MSDIIEALKQSAGQVLSGIDQKGQIKSALDGIRSQWSELERRRRANALRNEVKNLHGESKQLAEALGLLTLSLYDAGKIVHPELSRLCERLNELHAVVEQKKAELAQLEEEGRATTQGAQCPGCRASVEADAEFCPKCGAQLQTPSAAAAHDTSPAARKVVRLRCPKCKTIFDPGAAFCPTCGVKIVRRQASSTEPRFCPSCGAETSASARFCPICGQGVE